MGKDCFKGCKPETDESLLPCNGSFVTEDCVLVDRQPYLGISEVSSLGALIKIVVQRIRALTNAQGVWNNLQVFVDDETAEDGGILIGKPYVTPDGFVRIRMV